MPQNEMALSASSDSPQINYRMRATLTDGRQMAGQMLAFDKVTNH